MLFRRDFLLYLLNLVEMNWLVFGRMLFGWNPEIIRMKNFFIVKRIFAEIFFHAWWIFVFLFYIFNGILGDISWMRCRFVKKTLNMKIFPENVRKVCATIRKRLYLCSFFLNFWAIFYRISQSHMDGFRPGFFFLSLIAFGNISAANAPILMGFWI